MSKKAFSLDGSLVDLNRLNVPNFSRPTMTMLEREVDESLQIYPIEAFTPAIYYEDSAFLLEPVGQNCVTWNMKIDHASWLKGANLFIQVNDPDTVAPDSSRQAERIVWSPGSGATQLLRRNLLLDAGRVYTLSAILRLDSGRFVPSDVIRAVGGVVGSASVSLSLINRYLRRYRLLEFQFTAAGREPVYPENPHQATDYAVTQVTSSTITIAMSAIATANSMVGGQVGFSNVVNKLFTITANTATVGGSVTITLDITNLAGQGVTTASRASLKPAAKQSVDIEFYVESSVVLDWGGLQVEPSPFRTSMIYQEEEVKVRSKSYLTYRHSPIANLRTFGIFAELKFWRGDGNLMDLGNVKIWIQQGRLYAQAGATIVSDPDPLPSKNVEFFVQAAEETASFTLFVNGVLKARTALINFLADVYSPLVFSSDGVRAFQRVLTTDALVLDDNPAVGDFAKGDVADLFDNPTVIDATAISAHAPLINLTPVTVPAKEPPTARSRIDAINTTSRVVTVVSGQGFEDNEPVTVYRGDYLIVRARITNVDGDNITLDTVAAIVTDDILVQGNVDQPGQASVRFPWDPIDQQTILDIDSDQKRLRVATALSFVKDRAFVVTPLDQDIAEILVETVDPTNGFLYVSDVEGLSIGDIIAQPRNELLVDPANYFSGILNPVDGIRVKERFSNGLVIENDNSFPIVVRPYIRVYL